MIISTQLAINFYDKTIYSLMAKNNINSKTKITKKSVPAKPVLVKEEESKIEKEETLTEETVESKTEEQKTEDSNPFEPISMLHTEKVKLTDEKVEAKESLEEIHERLLKRWGIQYEMKLMSFQTRRKLSREKSIELLNIWYSKQ